MDFHFHFILSNLFALSFCSADYLANAFMFGHFVSPFCSTSIENVNGALISHDLHNALAVINHDQSNNIPKSSNAVATNGTTTSNSGSSGRSTPNNAESAPGKLFVGGLSWQTSADKLKEYFGMFGNVTDVLIMKDPVTQVIGRCQLVDGNSL